MVCPQRAYHVPYRCDRHPLSHQFKMEHMRRLQNTRLTLVQYQTYFPNELVFISPCNVRVDKIGEDDNARSYAPNFFENVV